MTLTCTDCHDDACIHMGSDERACEHHVRLSDLDPPDSRQGLAECVADLAKLREELSNLRAEFDGVIAAVIKARVGEGL